MKWAQRSLVLTVLLTVGCEGTVERESAIPLDQVTPALRKVAEETLPDVTFDSAWKIKVDGKDAYEIKGKDKRGKIREVEVSADGKVIEIE